MPALPAPSDERTKVNGLALTNGILGLTYSANANASQQTQYIRDPAGTLIAMRVSSNNTGWTSSGTALRTR